ncbi:MAG: carboxypeptidase regulatory-like domain-containing protein [Actinomycetales bacterium]
MRRTSSGSPIEHLAAMVVAMLLAVSSMLVPTGHARQALAAPSPGLAEVTGVVTDAETGAALAGAVIGNGQVHATAGADGHYRLELPPGQHVLTAALEGYQAGYYTDQTQDPPSREITLSADEERVGTDIGLHALGTVSGVVTGDVGPVPGVVVKLYLADSPDPNPVLTAVTGADGSYLLDGVPAGGYQVQFDAADTPFASRWYQAQATRADAQVLTLDWGAARPGVNAALVRGAQISGLVQDEAGEPLADVLVQAREQAGGKVAMTTTAADGTFTLTRLLAGQYTLSYRKSGYVTRSYGQAERSDRAEYFSVPESAIITGRDVTLQVGATVSGTVIGPDEQPVADAGVRLDRLDGGTMFTSTDADGTYLVEGVDVGTYRAYFWAPGQQPQYYPDSPTPAQAETFTLARGEAATGIDVQLSAREVPERPARISGRLTLDGADLSDATVEVSCTPPATATDPTPRTDAQSVITDADGSFELGVQAGECSVGVLDTTSPPRFAAGPWPGAEAVTTTDGEVTSLGVQSLAAAASMAGRITASGGQPVAGAQVIAIPGDGSQTSAAATTAADGSYLISGLTPDIYTLHVIPAGNSGLAEQYWRNALTLGQATYVVLGDGAAATGYDMTLSAAASISGRVTGPGGTALPGATVRAEQNAGNGRSVTTDANGHYTLGGLPSGYYRISYDAPGYNPQWWYQASSAEDAEYVSLSPGQAVSSLDASLAAAPTISGVIRNLSGSAPVPNATITVHTVDGTPLTSAVTGADGRYSVSVPTGTYLVQVSAPGLVSEWFDDQGDPATATPVEVGQAPVSLDAMLSTGGRVDATVAVPQGYDVTRAQVQAVSAETGEQFTCTLGATGICSISGLRLGHYTVAVSGPGLVTQWWQGVLDPAAATPLAIGTAPVALSFTAGTGASISGRVVRPDGTVVSAPVQAVDLATVRVVPNTSVTFGSDGGFVLRGLPAGSYALRAKDPASGAYIYHGGASSWSTASAINVGRDAQVGGVTITLPPATASLGGTVSWPAGTGPVTLALLDEVTNEVVRTTTLASPGTYQLPGLVPGGYLLSATGPGLTPTSQSVTVSGQTQANLSLVAAGSISGSIVNEAGKPISATVTVVDAAGGTYSASGSSFTLAMLAAGEATVWVQPAAPYVGRWLGAPGSGGAVTVNVVAGQVTSLPPAVVAFGGRIAGSVSAPATVEAYDTAGNLLASLDADGDYRLDAVAPGQVFVKFTPVDGNIASLWWPGVNTRGEALPVTVTAGQTTQDVRASFAPALAGGTVSGVTRLQGRETSMQVLLLAADGTVVDQTVSSSIGWYAFTAVPAGSYRLEGRVCTSTDSTGAQQDCTVQQWNGGAVFTLGDSELKTWMDLSVLAAGAQQFSSAPTPTITGVAQVGLPLTAERGDWQPADATFTYQWLVDSTPIPGATATTYIPTAEQQNGAFSVMVTATKPGFASTTRESARTDLTLAPALVGNEAFVRAAYQDFLGRQPTTEEVVDWLARFQSGTTTGQFLTEMATSPEWTTEILRKMYLDSLGREPDAGGLAYWSDVLGSGRLSVAQVAGFFYSSDEYFYVLGGGTNETWVADLYRKLLMREPDPDGLAYWVGVAQTQGRLAVAYAFYQSPESRRVRVQNLYQALLHREGDEDGVVYWTDRVLVSGDLALAISLADSQEYHQSADQRF